jgi:hypothetical protein
MMNIVVEAKNEARRLNRSISRGFPPLCARFQPDQSPFVAALSRAGAAGMIIVAETKGRLCRFPCRGRIKSFVVTVSVTDAAVRHSAAAKWRPG